MNQTQKLFFFFSGNGLAPTWKAVCPDSFGVISLQSKGTGTPTITRATPQWCYDSVDQYYKEFAADEPGLRGRITGVPGSHVVYNTDASGIELTDWGLQKDPPLTNLVIYSHDLSQSTYWTVYNTPVITYGATGLDGTGSATTIEDNDTASIASAVQALTILDDTAPYVFRLFVDKDTVETRFPRFNFYFTGGTTTLNPRYDLNTKTGAIYTVDAAGGSIEVNSIGSRWEIIISCANNALGNTILRATISPAQTSVFDGVNDVTATGSIIISNVEIYKNATIADIRGTGPIFTDAATVSTGVQTGPTYDSTNISDTSGAISFTAKTQCAGNLLATFAQHDGTNYLITDGTTSDISAIATNTRFKGGLWWHDSEMGLCINGVCNATIAYDGTILSGNLDLLQSATCAGEMREIKGYANGDASAYKKQLIEDTQ